MAKPLTIACIGTGPSLTARQIEIAREKGFGLFGCNRVWEIAELDLLYGCNKEFWNYYWGRGLKDCQAEKWTTNKEAAERYGLNHIGEVDRKGLSKDPSYVHHGHGSGYTLLNLAYLKGAERVVLLGYDLKYAQDYDGYNQIPGSGPRHYFGEYPEVLQHWPKLEVRQGVHVGLLELYETVKRQGAVEVVNCTPGSAITCFDSVSIDAL